MDIFFYGLFMDEWLLKKRGLKPSNVRRAHLNGYGLRIGDASTLVPSAEERTYGMLMALPQDEKEALYCDLEVVGYSPHLVKVVEADGTEADAICYTLPERKLGPLNKGYAEDLHYLATSLKFPAPYLNHLNRLAKGLKP